MNAIASRLLSRLKTVGQLLALPAVWMLVALIPLLVAANAVFLSRWLCQRGWAGLGAALWWLALTVAILTAVATIWFLGFWMFAIVQAVRGKLSLRDSEPGPNDDASDSG